MERLVEKVVTVTVVLEVLQRVKKNLSWAEASPSSLSLARRSGSSPPPPLLERPSAASPGSSKLSFSFFARRRLRPMQAAGAAAPPVGRTENSRQESSRYSRRQ